MRALGTPVEQGPGKQSRPVRYGRIAQLAFCGVAIALPAVAGTRAEVRTFAINFVAIVLEALPFMLLGSLVGGLIEVFVSRERIARLLPRRWWTIFLAAGFGMLFPVCECAIVPVIRRLLRKGIPFGAAIAYLLGGPIVNPLVGASTAVAYNGNWKIVVLRLGIGYLIALFVGFLMNALFDARQAVIGGTGDGADCGHDHCHHTDEPKSMSGKFLLAVQHAASDFFDIARFLIMGAFIAAGLQTLVSRQAFVSVTGVPVFSIAFMMVLAVALNLCSEADAFVAASFRSSGLPLSAQMAFMVLGPMLDLKLILMYIGVFRRKTIVVLATATTATVFLVMTILEFCL